MKPIRNVLGGLIIIGGAIFLANLLSAQETAAPVQAAPLSLTPADVATFSSLSEAQLAALVSALDETPTFAVEPGTNGTFWSLQNPGSAPLPFDSSGSAVWPMSDGSYLLDDLNFNYQAAAQTAQNGSLRMTSSLSEDGGSFAPLFASFDTNSLWLQITNVGDGLAYLNLMNGTDYIYEIFSKTDLTASNWDIAGEVFPSDTNCTPFTVPALDGTNLFIWARDWTGVTSNGNETPEWWFWKYFGTVDLSDTNLDGFDNSLLADYTADVDPNSILFSLQFPNDQVHTNIVNGAVTIFGGTPFYLAVLVNDTNQADAIWQPYTGTNFTVSLDAGDGIYSVRVGLRGLPDDAQQTWLGTELTLLHTAAPVFAITNPVLATVSTPMIQLQGFVSETLNTLTYDVSNALGVITNQPGYWNSAFYDTNLLAFTTNSFQCYDVALTNGVNLITLHATDLTGNAVTTNFCYTLDYSGKTNPPVLNIVWPQAGTTISGSSFTVQAQMDDATATVTATVTDTNGDTNGVQGLVERNGTVWADNLPLAAGTNTLTLTARDAAGNVSTTNFNIVQSGVGLTIDPMSSDQMNQPLVSVTGAIDNPDDSVTVNGVAAYFMDDDGDWEADDVPVNPTGTAALDVQVHEGDSTPAGEQIIGQPQSAVISQMSYTSHTHSDATWYYYCDGPSRGVFDEAANWLYLSGGVDSVSYVGKDGDCQPDNYSYVNRLAGGYNDYSPAWEIKNTTESIYYPPAPFSPSYELGSESDDAHARVMVLPSGQQAIGQTALYLVQAQVINEDTGEQVPASAVKFVNQLAGTTTEDVTTTDGSVWSQGIVEGAAGAQTEVTPKVFLPNISFNGMLVSNMQLHILANGIDLSTTTPEFCVGQAVTNQLIFEPPLPTNTVVSYQWRFQGDFINAITNTGGLDFSADRVIDSSLLQTDTASLWWYNGGTNLQVSCVLKIGAGNQTLTAKGYVSIYRPTLTAFTNQSPRSFLVLDDGDTLRYGDDITGDSNMTWHVAINSKYNGRNGITQIIAAEWWKEPTPGLIANVTNCVDANEFYDTTKPYYTNILGSQTVEFDDAPAVGIGLYSGELLFSSADDYVRFKPGANENDGNIYVTLGVIHWSAHGRYNNTTSTMTENNTPAASAPDNNDAFPVWYELYPEDQ